MSGHKYKVGDSVAFCPPSIKLVRTKSDVAGSREHFKIVQLLPPLEGQLQYRIKGGRDDTERMVVETELSPLPFI